MNDFYSKETIDAKLDTIHQNQKASHEVTHELLYEIKNEVKKTNGRVTALEKWKWTLTGGVIVLGALNIPNIKQIITLFQ